MANERIFTLIHMLDEDDKCSEQFERRKFELVLRAAPEYLMKALAQTTEDIEQGKYPARMLAALVLRAIGPADLLRYARLEKDLDAFTEGLGDA
jgi:hypothetical protein